MISKERLKELIEQGATIYEVKYGKINSVSLKNKIRFISKKYPVIVFEPRPNEKYKHHKYFDKLFETLEEAEWHKDFGCIERTERLELPTWEEFKNDGEFSFLDKQGFEWDLYSPDDKTRISLVGGYDHFEYEYDKKNYTIACRKAKELFLGGSDGDIR